MGQSIGEEAQRLIESLRKPVPPPDPHVQVHKPKGCVIILGGSPSVAIHKAEMESYARKKKAKDPGL